MLLVNAALGRTPFRSFALRWRAYQLAQPTRRLKAGLLIAALAIYVFLYSLLNLLSLSSSEEVLFTTKNPTTCPRFSVAHPYVPLNSTWRDLPMRHEASPLLQLPTSRPKRLRSVQYQFPRDYELSETQQHRRKVIKDVFIRSWNSYKETAWLKDELKPISGKFNDRYGGWAATLVDNLDTLWIMNLTTEFHEAVDAALSIDFGNPEHFTEDRISVFETTIRHLGGFISAYEMTDCADLRILNKATELGDLLYASFDTPHRVPGTWWSPRKALAGEVQLTTGDDNILANAASLTMEFTRLSQLTGDMRYFSAVQNITDGLAEQQNKTKRPGMWPQRFDPMKFDFTVGERYSLGAESDSAYEYLLKMILLLGNNDPAPQYEAMYEYAMDTAIKELIFRPMTADNSSVLLAGKTDPDFRPQSEHLACFTGGMFALGGRILDNDTHLDIGRRLTEGCSWAYQATPTGIAPENWNVIKCDSTAECEWNEKLWNDLGGSPLLPKGFTGVEDPRYHLRPEALESMFYMYRISGDTKYQDMAWDMFESIVKETETHFANAKLFSVLLENGPHIDEMESFWMAEALKYMYLLFSDPHTISLDDYVLSTEAHPFRIPKPG